jgi:hypothetical protein
MTQKAYSVVTNVCLGVAVAAALLSTPLERWSVLLLVVSGLTAVVAMFAYFWNQFQTPEQTSLRSSSTQQMFSGHGSGTSVASSGTYVSSAWVDANRVPWIWNQPSSTYDEELWESGERNYASGFYLASSQVTKEPLSPGPIIWQQLSSHEASRVDTLVDLMSRLSARGYDGYEIALSVDGTITVRARPAEVSLEDAFDVKVSPTEGQFIVPRGGRGVAGLK